MFFFVLYQMQHVVMISLGNVFFPAFGTRPANHRFLLPPSFSYSEREEETLRDFGVNRFALPHARWEKETRVYKGVPCLHSCPLFGSSCYSRDRETLAKEARFAILTVLLSTKKHPAGNFVRFRLPSLPEVRPADPGRACHPAVRAVPAADLPSQDEAAVAAEEVGAAGGVAEGQVVRLGNRRRDLS